MVLKNGWKKIPRLRVSPGNISTYHACPPALGMNLGFGGMPCVQADRQDTGATEYSRPPRAYQRPFWLPPASKARLPCVAKPFTTGFHVVLHSLYITPRRSRS